MESSPDSPIEPTPPPESAPEIAPSGDTPPEPALASPEGSESTEASTPASPADSPAAPEPSSPAPAPAPAAGPGVPPLKLVLEALIFSAQRPLNAKELRDYLSQAAQDETAPEATAYKKVKEDIIEEALLELQRDHAEAGRSYRLLSTSTGWQFASVPEYGPWLRALLGRKPRPPKLSQPGIETLTIVAYRQPVTRAEIEQIRGVSVDGVMQTLVERGLIEAVGRAEVVGRPVTYGTTPQFLEYFGIQSLSDLPSADDLRRIPVQRPDALLTTDPVPAPPPSEPAAPHPELPLPTPDAAPQASGEPAQPSPDSP